MDRSYVLEQRFGIGELEGAEPTVKGRHLPRSDVYYSFHRAPLLHDA